MSKYKVTFVKYEVYEVEANNMNEAEDKGIELLDADTAAFMFDPVDRIEVEEIESED